MKYRILDGPNILFGHPVNVLSELEAPDHLSKKLSIIKGGITIYSFEPIGKGRRGFEYLQMERELRTFICYHGIGNLVSIIRKINTEAGITKAAFHSGAIRGMTSAALNTYWAFLSHHFALS